MGETLPVNSHRVSSICWVSPIQGFRHDSSCSQGSAPLHPGLTYGPLSGASWKLIFRSTEQDFKLTACYLG
jgi:hypothetical protein